MGKLITITSQKGGCGKTTIVANFAVHIANKGKKVAIVDFDAQKNLTEWHEAREKEDLTLLNISLSEMLSAKDVITEKFDFVIIDTPPAANEQVGELVAISDYCFIPIKASPNDLRALNNTISMIRDSSCRDNFSFVINDIRGSRAQATASVTLSKIGAISAYIPSKNIFQEVMLPGLSVVEVKKYDESVKQFENMYNCIA